MKKRLFGQRIRRARRVAKSPPRLSQRRHARTETNARTVSCQIVACTRCSLRKFRVAGGGPGQTNCCKEAAADLLRCSCHLAASLREYGCGYFSRTQFKCSFTVVKTPLYCVGKYKDWKKTAFYTDYL